MIAALFLNPGFLFVAAALISVPIIIHLINRMRFKRIRWGAMEFLLKAQKRTRRRLIIEQLLLLALRCFLILLVGLLVLRFVGCGESNTGGRPNLHIVLLDDTVSMQDHWKQDNIKRDCFDVAKNDVILKIIAKEIAKSKSNDRLVIVPLSRLVDTEYDAKDLSYERLNDKQIMDKLTQEVTELKPSMLHVPMLQGLKKAQAIMGNHAESQVTLHIISDFRANDWGVPHSEALTKELLAMVKANKDIKIFPIDTAHPVRDRAQGGYPTAHDNIGITEVTAGTRVAGKNMRVEFTVAIKNFSGREFPDVMLVARDEVRGVDLPDVDFNPPGKINLKPNDTTNVNFTYRFSPDPNLIKPGLPYYAHLSLRVTSANLLDPEGDSLLADNLRHVVLEVRDKVPILIIDGNRQDGNLEGKDSFHIRHALESVDGKSYQVVLAHELPGAGADVTKALEMPDLNRYPTIFMLDVPSLTAKQATILENYVKEGGGVAFFLGKNVQPVLYNRMLYKDGQGLFPAPLQEPFFFPPPGKDPLEPKRSETDPIPPFQLLIRDEKLSDKRMMPIFGPIFSEPKQREVLRDLPIRRYFKVARNKWKLEPEKVFELATLPNDEPATTYGDTVVSITKSETVDSIKKNAEFAPFHASVGAHLDLIYSLAKPGSEHKAFQLADALHEFLNDKGQFKGGPDLTTTFWRDADEKVQALKVDVERLRDQIRYGDPFIVGRVFDKGKVVAVMSTAGKEWNDWGGGSVASFLYAPFILELQNYLTKREGADANLTTGRELSLNFDAEQLKGKQIKMLRYFVKTATNDKELPEWKDHGDPKSGEEKNGVIHFTLTKHNEPGLYVTKVIDENLPEGKNVIASYAHVFNVDTIHEGDLGRVGSDELKDQLAAIGGNIQLGDPTKDASFFVGRQNDWSESPWLFLILLLVLVAEQALAVHLSFHLKNTEEEAAPARVKV